VTYPPLDAEERTILTGFLDVHRANVLGRLDRAPAAQAATRLLPGTDMTIGGIVKHLAQMEDLYFPHKLLGRDMPAPWPGVEESWAWQSAAADSPAALRRLYDAACDRSRAAIASVQSLDERSALTMFRGGQVSLRWMLAQMISETAQHAGHLDVLLDAL